jgi:hypothetical protein
MAGGTLSTISDPFTTAVERLVTSAAGAAPKQAAWAVVEPDARHQTPDTRHRTPDTRRCKNWY